MFVGRPQGPDLRLGDVRLGEPSVSPELRNRLLPKSRSIRGATGLYAMNSRAWEPGQSPLVSTTIPHMPHTPSRHDTTLAFNFNLPPDRSNESNGLALSVFSFTFAWTI